MFWAKLIPNVTNDISFSQSNSETRYTLCTNYCVTTLFLPIWYIQVLLITKQYTNNNHSKSF